jgi:hypothetical protein
MATPKKAKKVVAAKKNCQASQEIFQKNDIIP